MNMILMNIKIPLKIGYHMRNSQRIFWNKETAGLKDWLTEVAEESDIDSDVVTAQSLLLSRLKNGETLSVFTRQPEQKYGRHDHFYVIAGVYGISGYG